MRAAKRSHLEDLTQRIQAVEQARGAGGGGGRRVATGWAAVDAALDGGLLGGAVHEWFASESDESETPAGCCGPSVWRPPLAMLMHLAKQATGAGVGRDRSSGWVVWVGQRCWPHPHGLAGGGNALLKRSLWVDPPDRSSRLWAIDLAARCGGTSGVAAVVGDGSGLDMSATRRLQLAAEAGGALVLLGRPAAEQKAISAATTRWSVAPAISVTKSPRWELQLWRCKGGQRGAVRDGRGVWLLEGVRSRGQGLVVVAADAGDRSDPAQDTEAEASSVERRRA